MKPHILWTYRVTLLMPALILFVLAVPRFFTGLVINAAFPVPTYIGMNVALPPSVYKSAAATLAHANSADGATRIAQAEAVALSSSQPQAVVELVTDGLASLPASARGWTLLAEQEMGRDPRRAAKCLAVALELGPYDFWIAGRRTRDSALLWNLLPPDAQEAAIRQTRLLWSEKALHREILALRTTEAGAQLMTRALKDEPDEIRALNRWVAAERLKGASH